ncbi:MAG: hypothetical protein ABI898_13360 [Sphingomonadales bacterium]
MTVRQLLCWFADRPVAALPLFALAALERVVWALAGHMQNLDTELRNVAIYWGSTGVMADAFRVGSGPTAHVGPLPPIVPGIVFRAFGADSRAGTLLLVALGTLAIVATALVLSRVFARLGTPAALRGTAVLLICLLPLHLELEARSLRIYENGYAALALAVLLLAVLRLDVGRAIDVKDMVGMSAFAALILALSPTAGFCAIAMLGVLALRRLDWTGRLRAAALLSVIVIAANLPWALHNRDTLGDMVWTRDNFGLEFAIGTHPAAVDPVDPAATYLARLAEIHPHGSDPAYRAMRAAGGELAYARKLGTETWAWVFAHPVDALTIWARHWREFFFPPPWMWFHTAPPDATTPARIIMVDAIAVLALVGLAGALARRQWLFLYLVPPVVLLPLPYLLSQPLVRYRYVIASLLIFLAADCLARLTGRGHGALKRVA